MSDTPKVQMNFNAPVHPAPETAYSLENDPILALAGTLHLGTPDLAENHDRYVGEALAKDLAPDE